MDAVGLCNIALDQIVARTSITGLSPPSPPNNLAAQVAARTYQTQVNAIFRAAHWNSARFQEQLTLLKAAVGTPENPSGSGPQPPIPWRYEYAYPDDCLLMRFVIPQPNLPVPGSAPLMTNIGVTNQPLVRTSMPFVPATDKDQSGNRVKVILTNACRAQGVYTGRVDNVDIWDASLQNAVIGALASWFALPVTGDKSLMTLRTQVAVGLINEARRSDGNEGITSVDVIPDWMQARNAGAGWGAGFGFGSGDDGNGFIASYGTWGAPDGVSY